MDRVSVYFISLQKGYVTLFEKLFYSKVMLATSFFLYSTGELPGLQMGFHVTTSSNKIKASFIQSPKSPCLSLGDYGVSIYPPHDNEIFYFLFYEK